MTAAPPPDPLWAHKAHALLLPTPLADSDPDREGARVGELRDCLARHGLGLSDDEWTTYAELHAQAHRDAHDAHIPAGTPATVGLAPYLRHPLTGELARQPARVFRPDDWPQFLGELDRLLADEQHPRDQYVALWRALWSPDERFGLARLPGHAIFNDHSLLAHRSAAAALVGARLRGDRAALLHFHLGPVQSFITTARRTHDLALGSYIVAYLSFHAVSEIATSCGPDAILYPDLATLPLYRAALDPLAALRASLPNRFMAIVPESSARAIFEQAARTVFKTWREMADSARDALIHDLSPSLRADAHWRDFDPQIDAHLEIDAVLHTWPSDPPRSEESVYKQLFTIARHDLTDQRRLLTTLPPPGSAVAKCTQCGEREQIGHDAGGQKFWTVLRKHLDARFSNRALGDDRETIDLRDGEALCAICLTKRFANRWYFGAPTRSLLRLDWQKTDTDRLLLRFPSVASIASAPARLALLRSARDPAAWNTALTTVHNALKFTPPGNLLPALDGPQRTGKNHLDVDGTWFYDTSYDPDTARRDHDSTEDPEAFKQALKGPLSVARKALGELFADIHVTPYYAVLNLDVDRMGKWLDGSHRDTPKRGAFLATITNPDQGRELHPALHREISRRQSQLASDPIYRIVEREHLGRVIYSGGDDLLAILPLATLWRCLSALHALFRSDDALGAKVTLSAGVSITHWRSPLSQALSLSRHAEDFAKKTRDRLIVRVDTRSGVPLSVPLDWATLTDLHDLDVLASPTEDRPQATAEAAGDSDALKIRLNTLEALEQELEALLPDSLAAHPLPIEALRSRIYLHITMARLTASQAHRPLLRQVEAILTRDIEGYTPKLRRRDLLDYLHLLRFLAREHDPVIAHALPSPSRKDS